MCIRDSLRSLPDQLVLGRGWSCYQLDIRDLLVLPRVAFRVVLGVGEALPVLVVDDREVTTVVVTGVAGLFAEVDMAGMSLSGPDAVVVLPAAQQIMEISGCEPGGILFQDLELLHA